LEKLVPDGQQFGGSPIGRSGGQLGVLVFGDRHAPSRNSVPRGQQFGGVPWKPSGQRPKSVRVGRGDDPAFGRQAPLRNSVPRGQQFGGVP